MASNTINLNVRVDEEVKRHAESIFNELGMNLTTALNLFLRSAIRYKGIPFDLQLEQPTADELTANWKPGDWANVRKMIEKSEEEYALGHESDAFEDLEELRTQYGL